MDAEAFWAVIGRYNQATWGIQAVLLAAVAAGIITASLQRAVWLPKVTLGITNLFLGVVFFLYYGTEPIQTFFAAPLYIAVGILFLWEGIRYRDSAFVRFNRVQWALLALVMLYPVVSLCMGHTFPQMVVCIMPCPVVSLSILVYSCYAHKNKFLLALLTLWGLTGIKSVFFNAWEDMILLLCGVYCLCLFIGEIKRAKNGV